MWLRRLSTLNFRNLEDAEIHFEQGLNWLVGANGQGKTNGLEAVYFLLTGKSFRTARITEMLRDPKSEAGVHGELVKGDHGSRFGVTVQEGRAKREIAGKAVKAPELLALGAVLSFTSRSKDLVEGSPEDRRRFLDRMICYLDPDHLYQLARYRKIHAQLREILHKSKDLSVYKSFKNSLLTPAKKIATARMDFLERIRESTSEFYKRVFEGEKELAFTYKIKSCTSLDKLEQKMMDVCAQEILYGRSMAGPHLDDLQIALDDGKAKHLASSGQVRAIVLSMDLALRERYHQRHGLHPIMLLDDIDAELDLKRLSNLLNYLNDEGQTLISTSKYDILQPQRHGCVFHVKAGRISSERIL